MTTTTTTTTEKRGQFANLRDHPRQSARQRHIEQRHLYSSLFTLPVVEKLAQDEKSGIVGLDLFKTISMHCRFIGREADGISHVLNEELFKHSEQYGGIVVAFGNSSLATGSAPSFEHDLRWIFHKIETRIYVFKPEVGSILRGIVNSRSSPNFIGCLIHTVFNAAVWIDEEEQGIHGEIVDGDEIEFQVTRVFFTSDTVTINGSLVGSRRRDSAVDIPSHTQEEKSNTKADADDEDEEDVDDGYVSRQNAEEASSEAIDSASLPPPASSNAANAQQEISPYSAVSDQFASRSRDSNQSSAKDDGSASASASASDSCEETRIKTKKKKSKSASESACEVTAESIDASLCEPSHCGEEGSKKEKKKKKKKDKERGESSIVTDASIVNDVSVVAETAVADASVAADDSDAVKVKHKKKKRDKSETHETHPSISIADNSIVDSSAIAEGESLVKVKHKKRKRDKEAQEHCDAIPELILEKKRKRESEGSSDGVTRDEKTAVTEGFDEDDDFEPPPKKKKKKTKSTD